MTLPVNEQLQKKLSIVSAYDSEFKEWYTRCRKIVKTYRDDGKDQRSKYNILWSNVQTLVPAVYSGMPKASVSRRHKDEDPVGRIASMIIERALDFEIEHYSDFRSAMEHSVRDRFLGGRGVSWVRFEPHIKKVGPLDDGLSITEDIEIGETDETEDYGPESPVDGLGSDPGDFTTPSEEPQDEEIDYECSPADYVHWEDFGHYPARTWEEVPCVWRWVYMSEESFRERFGEEKAKRVSFSKRQPSLDTKLANKTPDKARVCEFWDKESGKVYWFCEEYIDDFIDERDDPLELEGFFPCPKPLYATTTSDSLIPVPDYVLYSEQAADLSLLSSRISQLVSALRVRGVYDASVPELKRLLTEGGNNDLIPVANWAAFSEKGGNKGAIDLLPITDLASALLQCYQAQTQIKGQIYDITGISDIIRGQSVASETATAQQIKGQYAGLRLRAMQEAVALYASDILRIKAQVICKQFQPETILKYAAADQLSKEDQALVPQALDLIKNSPLQRFRIEVAADSLVQIDENQIKQDRMEFLNAISNFFRETLPVGQASPEMIPVIGALMKFGMAAFKQASTVEGVIDSAMQQMATKSQQAAAQPQGPSPEQLKAQADQQAAQAAMQADLQVENIRAQNKTQIEQMRAQNEAEIEKMRLQSESQMQSMALAQKEQLELQKLDIEGQIKITIAEIMAAQKAQPTPEANLAKV
jgi:hypothetical protein